MTMNTTTTPADTTDAQASLASLLEQARSTDADQLTIFDVLADADPECGMCHRHRPAATHCHDSEDGDYAVCAECDAVTDGDYADPLGIVTEAPRKTCPVARFGRPHMWVTGAFYVEGRLVESDDYVKCAECGQVEFDGAV